MDMHNWNSESYGTVEDSFGNLISFHQMNKDNPGTGTMAWSNAWQFVHGCDWSYTIQLPGERDWLPSRYGYPTDAGY